MINLDRRALDHVNVPGRYEFIYPGIGPYDTYLHSGRLSSRKWSSAPYLSEDELLTVFMVQYQFTDPLPLKYTTNYWASMTLKSRGAKIDHQLYDDLYDAIDMDIEYTPVYPGGRGHFPYTDESLIRSVMPGGVVLSSMAHTDEEFSNLSDEQRDIVLAEYTLFLALKYHIVADGYTDLSQPSAYMAVLNSIPYVRRSHPLYQGRRWAVESTSWISLAKHLSETLVSTHIANHSVLEHSVDSSVDTAVR